MYILIRNDLSNAQKAVQACHAAIESSRQFTKPTDEHPSVILCSVKNENKLLKCAKELEDLGIEHTIFREPDIGNQATALASKPLIGKDRKAFSRFQLLT
jgi:peptidyl-tRNA hydrolase